MTTRWIRDLRAFQRRIRTQLSSAHGEGGLAPAGLANIQVDWLKNAYAQNLSAKKLLKFVRFELVCGVLGD
jgi:hypothetical protein